MFKHVSQKIVVAVLTATFSFWAIGWTARPVYAQHSGHSHSSHAHSAGEDHAAHGDAAGAPTAKAGPHGGQITRVEGGAFEVVYQPKEIRVHLYEASGRPVSAERVQGEVTLQVRGQAEVFCYPLKYIAPPARSQDHDYLAVAVDVSRVRDGDMQAGFQFGSLPFAQPQAGFTQVFALSKPLVTVAAIGQADRAAVAQQKVCPVTGEGLDSMGGPIKLLVGEQPLYVCCQGCVNKVRQNPDLYLDKVAIARQRICPVTGEELDSMGGAIKLVVGGQPLYVCCQGCVRKVQQSPDLYLAKARQLRGDR